MATKELKDYLHYYLGCGCILVKSDGGYDVPKEGSQLMLTPDLLMQCLRTDIKPFLEVEPILRPLSDMTEEEAIECAKLSEWEPHFRSPKVERTKYNDLVVTWDGANEGGETQNVTGDCFYCAEQFQYLLSKHFDLFELIQYELAIDKTKL